MLPFLQPKKIGSVIIAKRNKDGKQTDMQHESEHAPELMEAAQHMVSGVHAKDATTVAEAMQKAHKHLNAHKEKDASHKE